MRCLKCRRPDGDWTHLTGECNRCYATRVWARIWNTQANESKERQCLTETIRTRSSLRASGSR